MIKEDKGFERSHNIDPRFGVVVGIVVVSSSKKTSSIDLGSFADVPAVIRIIDASSDSTMMLSFLHGCDVPRSVFSHNGVAVESSSGSVCVLLV
jgi:hypothetical protein